MGSLVHKLLWGAVRVTGYVAAYPGNLAWKIGYNGYYGLSGGKVAVVGSKPTVTVLPPPTASAPVTAPQTVAAAA